MTPIVLAALIRVDLRFILSPGIAAWTKVPRKPRNFRFRIFYKYELLEINP